MAKRRRIRLPRSGFVHLLYITDDIKRLISNRYPNHACLNKGTRIKLADHNILFMIR